MKKYELVFMLTHKKDNQKLFKLIKTAYAISGNNNNTSFPYVSIVFVKTLLFPDAYFIFCNCYLQCMIRFSVFFFFLLFFNICICHLLFY